MTNTLAPSFVINQTYSIEAFLGSGAFGDVYRASHRFLGPQAIKVLKPGNDQVSSNLLTEARILVDLTHRNIVRLYDANICEAEDSTFTFMAMEFAEKGTLDDLLKGQIRLPESHVLSMGLQLASALEATHSRPTPLLHRDIKPSNILVFDSGPKGFLVKLSDFGMATTVDPDTRLTRSAGTIAYAPPEMAWGFTDERGDIYSVGVTLYRCLTGVHPFPLTSPDQLSASREFSFALTNGRKAIVQPSRLLMRPVNKLDEVIMRCLAFDIFDRYKDGAALLAALSNL